MSRLIAACLLCTICVIGSQAQEAPQPAPAKRVQAEQDVRFLITEVDGKPVWELGGTVELTLSELISAWVGSTGNCLLVQAKDLRAVVTYEAPLSGVTLTGDAITSFVSDMLALLEARILATRTCSSSLARNTRPPPPIPSG